MKASIVTNRGFFYYNNMNIVNPNNTSHEVHIIPRWEPIDIEVSLYNEQTQLINIVPADFTFANGYLSVYFNYTFVNGQKFQIKITDESAVLYRGKLIVTAQDTQDFKASNELYYYE